MRRSGGYTILELLIALAVLGGVLAVAYNNIGQGLAMHNDQEVATSAQSRLRRVMEVFTQDLRGSLMGAILQQGGDYSSDANSVSFALLEGGAGYAVLPDSSGTATGFAGARNVRIVSTATSTTELGIASGDQIMLVRGKKENADGSSSELTDNAVLLTVSGTPTTVTDGWQISHGGCGSSGNTLAYEEGLVQLFKVRSLGFRHTGTATGTNGALLNELRQRTANAGDVVLASGVTEFRVDYTYAHDPQGVAPSLDPITNPRTPAYDQAFPARTVVRASNGERYRLTRLQVVVGSKLPGTGGRMIERKYAGQVELSSADKEDALRINEVVTC